MKVFLDYKKLHTDSGKSKFLKRLIPELEKIGVSVRFKPKDCDIALGISKWRTDFKGMPKCLRVDGIHLSDTKEAKWRNEQIRKAIKHSDGVIWQSKFARDTIMKKLKVVPKKAWVIYNGAVHASYVDEVFARNKPLDTDLQILMASHWGIKKKRKHKRFKEMISIVKDYIVKNKNARLSVVGECGIAKSDFEGIYFWGDRDEENLRRMFMTHHVMLHVVEYGWCDNVVVEALCMGLPIICCKNSGVDELVGNSGFVVSNKLTKQEVFEALDNAREFERKPNFHKLSIYRPDLFIENIAKRYKKAFEECLQ